jgi:hypothetical protein
MTRTGIDDALAAAPAPDRAEIAGVLQRARLALRSDTGAGG